MTIMKIPPGVLLLVKDPLGGRVIEHKRVCFINWKSENNNKVENSLS